MKKLLILLFSLLISFNSYGLFEKTVCVDTHTVERGGIIYLPNKTKPFTGENLCEYESGQYKSQGKINEGKRDDNWTEWDRNGLKQSELHYKDGKLVGKTNTTITVMVRERQRKSTKLLPNQQQKTASQMASGLFGMRMVRKGQS